MQQLQIDLREARDNVTGKNQELLQLNRDNVRLTEKTGQQDREVRELRLQARRLDEEVQALRPIARELDGLEVRWAHEQLVSEALRADLTSVREALAQEEASRQAAEKAIA